MATLEGKTIVVVGATSGIGLAVAKGSLLSGAEHVVVVSSSAERVQKTVTQLQALGKGKVSGQVVDATQPAAVQAFFEKLGPIDHLAWTSGDALKTGFPNMDLDAVRSQFDVRFWGAVTAAKYAKFKEGGSLTLTLGSVLVKPAQTWSLVAGVAGAVDGLVRGLAVDLAPVRVNSVSPHFVKTELWKEMPVDVRDKLFEEAAAKLPVRHIAEPEEIAEAYLFLFKCAYITGQRIDLDGGYVLV